MASACTALDQWLASMNLLIQSACALFAAVTQVYVQRPEAMSPAGGYAE